MIRIAFDENTPPWSLVGTGALIFKNDYATMNLGQVKSQPLSMTQEERMVIFHEFGHALGLLHEHQSPARTGVLTFNEQGNHSCDANRLILIIINNLQTQEKSSEEPKGGRRATHVTMSFVCLIFRNSRHTHH